MDNLARLLTSNIEVDNLTDEVDNLADEVDNLADEVNNLARKSWLDCPPQPG